jgi:hypothetical protein
LIAIVASRHRDCVELVGQVVYRITIDFVILVYDIAVIQISIPGEKQYFKPENYISAKIKIRIQALFLMIVSNDYVS